MNKLQQLILVMLKHRGAMTGYDMAKLLKGRTNHTTQQVYRDCAKLEVEGFISSTRVVNHDKPDAKLYELVPDNIFGLTHEYSDFTKTNGSMWCAHDDIKLDVDLHRQYMEHMQKAEIEFFKGIL